MVKFPSNDRVECLNEIRPGKICGAHISAGRSWCPVCGEPTRTRRVNGSYEVSQERLARRELTMLATMRGVH